MSEVKSKEFKLLVPYKGFEKDELSELLLSDTSIDSQTYLTLIRGLTERYRRHQAEKATLAVSDSEARAPKIRPIRRALLIGINYLGTSYQLSGCINDTDNLRVKLESTGVINSGLGDSLTVMTDNSSGSLYPTRANILAQLANLRVWANSQTVPVELIIMYSGHGSNVADARKGDESDRRDEVLCPVDFDRSGFITDDQIRSEFLTRLGKNSSIVFLIDACNSGTICDLQYRYNIDRTNSFSRFNYDPLTNVGRCICISACLDTQTAADAWLPDAVTGKYEAQGALIGSFVTCYDSSLTIYQLIDRMRSWIKSRGFTQITQLTSGLWLNPTGDKLF